MSGWKQYSTSEGQVYYYNELTGDTSWDRPSELSGSSGGGDLLYWIPHEVHGYIPGTFLQERASGSLVESIDGEQFTTDVPRAKMLSAARSVIEKNVDDLVQMDDINEAMIVHNLRKRFKNNEIYTNIGTILISINPFKRLPLYTPTILDQYMHKGTKTLAPHTFGIADDAFRAMVDNKMNQSILISGESGAGKTECTKQCLNYFAELAGSTNGVEQNILLANPILESFGNAKTLRNNNSSRFGKWVECHFDTNYKICGANTINYLLEKSRVVHQIKGERNFHIFYQLCMGATEEQRREWQLGDPKMYNYLNKSGCITVDGADDAKDFEEVKEAMEKLQFTESEMHSVFTLIAAILHMGNIEFKPLSADDESKSVVVNKEEVKIAARLLKVDPDDLERAFLTRIMEIKGCAPTTIPNSPVMAGDARNALVKAFYGRLFDWLVERINASMRPSAGVRTSVIGVLDIFGFEIFEKNSFEQLCINFTNEKLQQHFNQYTFKLEERLYQTEEINYEHITFIDNQPVLDLIEKTVPQGIMIALDEQIKVPKATDQTFLIACNKAHGAKQHPNYLEVRTTQTNFIIKHYAGDVTYDCTGMLDKNKDTLPKDLTICACKSKDPFINILFPPANLDESKTSKITLGGQFRLQLGELMKTLNATEPHYIRCIKPNNEKVPDLFSGQMSLQQLRYAGVFEAVRIRQTGYPFRYSHKDFLKRYGFMGGPTIKSMADAKAACKALLGQLKGDWSEVQIGRTKVLYRAKQQRSLELLRNVQVEKVTIVVQAELRRVVMMAAAAKMRAVKPILEAALMRPTLEGIEAALEKAKEIDFPMHCLTACQEKRRWLIREKEILAELQRLISQNRHEENFEPLHALTTEAVEMGMKDELTNRCNTIVSGIYNIRACRKDLQESVATNDRPRLEAALARAAELQFNPADQALVAAKAELERLRKEEALMASLSNAINSGAATPVSNTDWGHGTIDTSQLKSAIPQAEAFGLKTEKGIQLLKHAQVTLKMREALLQENYDILRQVLMQASSVGLSNQETKKAHEEVSHHTAVNDILANLAVAIQEHQQDVLAYNVEQAMNLGVANLPEVAQADALLQQIIYTRDLLQRAIAAVEQTALEEAVAAADSFNYVREEVPHAKKLLADVTKVNMDCVQGLFYIDRPYLESASALAQEIGMHTPQLDEVEKILVLDEQGFLQKQLKKANELGDKKRSVRLCIALKDIFFRAHGKMFVFEEFGQLRTREAFSKAKMFGREALREGMLKWTKQPLPTSLTNLLDPLHVKMATRLFKNVLGFMGDRPYSYPEELAKDLMKQGLENVVIRDEIYCQLIKQLNENPDPHSVKKGWTLMAFCLQTFAPTDNFVNFLEMFLAAKGKTDNYIAMLHDTQYGAPKTDIPDIEVIKTTLGNYVPVIDMSKLHEIDRTLAQPSSLQSLHLSAPGPSLHPIQSSPQQTPPPQQQIAAPPQSPQPPPQQSSPLSRSQTLGQQQSQQYTPPPQQRPTSVTLGQATMAPTLRGQGPPPSSPSSARGPAAATGSASPTQQQPQQAQQQQQQAQQAQQGAAAPGGTKVYAPGQKMVAVLYDYDGGGNPKRLVIKKGNIITVLKEYDAGWALGRLDGVDGLFPLNYTKVISSAPQGGAPPPLPNRD